MAGQYLADTGMMLVGDVLAAPVHTSTDVQRTIKAPPVMVFGKVQHPPTDKHRCSVLPVDPVQRETGIELLVTIMT